MEMSLDPSHFVLVAPLYNLKLRYLLFVSQKIVWGFINAWKFGMIWKGGTKKRVFLRSWKIGKLGENKAKGHEKRKIRYQVEQNKASQP